MTKRPGCPLCEGDGGRLVSSSSKWRIIHAPEPGIPGFYRVVWHEHIREFTDLSAADRVACMEAVAHVETLVRRHLQPTKVNVATLGNVVPHLHWHVIARFDWDTHFPSPVWAPAQRPLDGARVAEVESRLAALETDLGKPASPA